VLKDGYNIIRLVCKYDVFDIIILNEIKL